MFTLGSVSEPVVEHGAMMSSGDMHVRCNNDPEFDREFPAADWVRRRQRQGGRVYARTVIVVEDWQLMPPDTGQPTDR